MKSVIGIHLTILVLSVSGSLPSSLNTSDHEIYIEGSTIKKIIKIGPSDRLSMSLRTMRIAISPRAFQNSGVKTLHLNFDTPADLASKTAQIALQPESLLGLDLDSLSLTRVDLTLSADALTPLGSLGHLSLISCDVIEVPTALLMSFPKLGSLILSRNNISVVHHNAFEPLKRLWYLDLASNNISAFEPGCFNGLEELERLDLSNNSFAFMPAVFDRLPKLMELHIRECPYLRKIDINAFRKTPTLTSLTISRTGVHTLQTGVFDSLARLGWLHLGGNRIGHVPKNLFNKLESLDYLFLDNNEIVGMDSRAFAGLNLRYLGLSHQSPTAGELFRPRRLVIGNGTFSDLIADIVYMVGTSSPDIRPGAFEGLSAGLLDLRCLGIGRIDAEMFSGVRARKLDLRMNSISEIDSNAFKRVIGEEVDLLGNPIKITDKENWDISESLFINI